MGRLSATFELTNYRDLLLARQGFLAEEKVRRTTVVGTVNTKAMHMVLPQFIVDLLGLPLSKMPATHRGQRRDMVNDACVQLFGRSGVFSAIVEPNRTDALLGAIVMVDLDLIVDCEKNELMPRDPNGIITEIE